MFLATRCGPEKKVATQVEVEITAYTYDSNNKPVGDVVFYINGKKAGITQPNGRQTVKHAAKPGEVITFDVDEPDGYRVGAGNDRSGWRSPPIKGDGTQAPITFGVQFSVPERAYVLLVKGKTGNQSVYLNGKKVGTTPKAGTAILRVKAYLVQSSLRKSVPSD